MAMDDALQELHPHRRPAAGPAGRSRRRGLHHLDAAAQNRDLALPPASLGAPSPTSPQAACPGPPRVPKPIRSVRIRSTTPVRLLHGCVLLPSRISGAGTGKAILDVSAMIVLFGVSSSPSSIIDGFQAGSLG